MKDRCRTCKNWKRNIDKYDNIHYGECSSPNLFYSKEINSEDYPPYGLEYCDCECYAAYMSTSELFGCIHHTPLPKGETK